MLYSFLPALTAPTRPFAIVVPASDRDGRMCKDAVMISPNIAFREGVAMGNCLDLACCGHIMGCDFTFKEASECRKASYW